MFRTIFQLEADILTLKTQMTQVQLDLKLIQIRLTKVEIKVAALGG